MSEKDGETHTRILDTATRLFAARGFEKVTVREICHEAAANVAAVNYHFGDKLGLYREVLGQAIEEMQRTTEAGRLAGEGHTSAEKLRAYIGVFLHRVIGHGRDSWIHQLMAHEMADPTPALDLVIEQVIRPRMAYLTELVADLLETSPDDDRVLRCVLSVQSQFHALMTNPVARKMVPDVGTDLPTIEAWIEHISCFSLSGIHALRSVSPKAFAVVIPRPDHAGSHGELPPSD
jgi:AcrR family transcriptional regulator